MRRAAAVVPEAVPELLGQDPRPASWSWPISIRRGTACGRRSCGRDGPSPRSRGRSGSASCEFMRRAPTIRGRRRFRDRSDLLCHPARALSGRNGGIHPDRAAALQALVETTAATRRCLVHGDVSPKNILVGPQGPVFLDAECAWFGDPAFDLAFCLNHLLLKCLWTPRGAARFSRLLRCAGATLSGRRRVGAGGRGRSARRAAAAGPVPGARRRQVAGRISDRRGGQEQGAPGGAGAAGGAGPPARSTCARLGRGDRRCDGTAIAAVRGPARLGFARPADGRGRGRSRRRRGGPGDRARRRLDRLGRGARPARRRHALGRL